MITARARSQPAFERKLSRYGTLRSELADLCLTPPLSERLTPAGDRKGRLTDLTHVLGRGPAEVVNHTNTRSDESFLDSSGLLSAVGFAFLVLLSCYLQL